ncbi:MAG: hypothetical protein IK115_06130, partial [Lachnospiraceae bacterium]|nr:hypothetical protein [Lachnospiraceae bacterium]
SISAVQDFKTNEAPYMKGAVMSENKYSIGIDAGGTKVAYGLFDQDGELVESYVESETVGVSDEYKLPCLQESVSLGKDGKLHITLNNLSHDKDYELETVLTDAAVKSVAGEIVGGEMHEHNTFEEPERVVKKSFDAVEIKDGKLHFVMPKSSVLHLAVEI